MTESLTFVIQGIADQSSAIPILKAGYDDYFVIRNILVALQRQIWLFWPGLKCHHWISSEGYIIPALGL